MPARPAKAATETRYKEEEVHEETTFVGGFGPGHGADIAAVERVRGERACRSEERRVGKECL